LWKKVKDQDTHLHYFPTFEALTLRVEQAMLKFANAPQEILALCAACQPNWRWPLERVNGQRGKTFS
ncbi:MAG: hypothetical protein ACKVZH_25800, partial [Blastocatellia bacterium]